MASEILEKRREQAFPKLTAQQIARLDKGFVRTGADLSAEGLAAAQWPLPRAPYLGETSIPGVFAVGDVRSGSVKRVASAVGEGSICIQFVHRALRDIAVPSAAITMAS